MADVDQLMSEMGWVRRLARGLLGDADAADDIAQETWLVANDRTLGEDRPLRPWLHRVVLNLVRMRARSDARRNRREVVEEQPPPTADQLLERVETQRMLVDEVIALREPYRSTVVLRYVEGLSSAEIARRLEISPAAVRQRLKSALDELRDRIRAREDGPRRGWLAALAPFANTNSHVAMGVLAMKKAIAVVVLLILLLGGAAVVRSIHHHDASTTPQVVTSIPALISFTTHLNPRPRTLPTWLAQLGAPPRHLAGHVFVADKPAPNVTVRLGISLGSPHSPAPSITPGPPFVEVAKLTTDAAGAFDFGILPAANFVVSAETTAAASASIGIMTANPHVDTDHLVLRLGDCTLRVVGTVRDAANSIAHARINVSGLAGTESDANGHYSVCIAPSRYPNMRIEADGYGSVNVQIPSLTGEFHRDLILVPEATISGIVVDEAGAPVASAVVSAHAIQGNSIDEASNVDVVADESGHFQISGLAPTAFSLAAFSATGTSSTRPRVVTLAGAATRNLRLVIAKRARLRGTVSMAGTAVVGASVSFGNGSFGEWSPTTAETQVDGSFVLEDVPFGTIGLLVHSYEVVAPATLVVAHAETNGVAIEVSALSTIHGRITRHGVPAPGTVVGCSLQQFGKAVSDDEGNYTLSGVSPGNGSMDANNGKAFTNHPVVVTKASDQTLDLELDGGGEVRGTVVDENAVPVPSVFVVFDSHADDSCEAMTDANGTFSCATLIGHLDYEPAVFPSSTRQHAFAPATGSSFLSVHIDDGNALVTNVRLAIKHDQKSIRGRVVDYAGAPVSDARVAIAGANEWADQHRTRTGADGSFAIDSLADGTYDLKARLADGSQADALAIAAGAENVEIRLISPGSINGSLKGFVRPPWVVAEDPVGALGDRQQAVVEGDHFTISGLRPGTYQVQAVVDGAQSDAVAVAVRSNEVATTTLTSRQRVAIQGRVVEFGTNIPVAGMICRAGLEVVSGDTAILFPSQSHSMTDSSGAFSLDALLGHDRVTCAANGGLWSDGGGNLETTLGSNHIEVFAVKALKESDNPPFTLNASVMPPLVTGTRCGVAVGDTLVAINGIPVSALLPSAALALVNNYLAAGAVTVQVMRGSSTLSVRVP